MILRNLNKVVLFFAMSFITIGVQAQVSVFTGDSGEKLVIQATPELGKDTALIKFEGTPQSPWQNKIIKVNKTNHSSGDRYNFEYTLVLSDGNHKKEWGILVESGTKLIKGTQARRMELYLQGSQKPVQLFHDVGLTKSSQKIDMKADYKKKPYIPVVD